MKLFALIASVVIAQYNPEGGAGYDEDGYGEAGYGSQAAQDWGFHFAAKINKIYSVESTFLI